MLDTTSTQAMVEQESETASDDERAALLSRLGQYEQVLAVLGSPD